jgi:hypothetical protein
MSHKHTFFAAAGLLALRSLLSAQALPELTPSLHAFGVLGSSSADHAGDFAPGAHDPNRNEAFQVQSIEPGLSLRWGNHLQGFATATAFTDDKDNFDWEWEEYFLKLANLPAGMELRGGRFLNRVGLHNSTHLHSWSTVDAPLPHALFLGEEGLSTQGGEVNFHLDGPHPTVLSLSFGKAPSHSHAHGHVEEHHEDEGDEHEEHAHTHEEGFGSLEAFRLQDDILTLGLRRLYRHNDFHSFTLAAFGGVGDNEEGGDAWFAGAGLEYQWRENGLAPGGRALRWRSEVIRFAANGAAHEEEHHEEAEHEHEENIFVSARGLSTQLVCEATPHVHPFARIDAIGAIDALELSSWTRYTLGATFPLLAHDPGLYLRLQGNADERGDESEQSIWLQVGFSWGGPEVR